MEDARVVVSCLDFPRLVSSMLHVSAGNFFLLLTGPAGEQAFFKVP